MSKFAIAPVIAAAALAARAKTAGSALYLPAADERETPPALPWVGAEIIEAVDLDARVEVSTVEAAAPPLPGELRTAVARNDRLVDALYYEGSSSEDLVGIRIAIDGTVILYVRR